MVAYGFRLFLVEVHLGRKHAPMELDDLLEAGRLGPAVEELHRHLLDLQDRLLFGPATYRTAPLEDGEDDEVETDKRNKRHPYVRIHDVTRQANRVDVSLDYGREGDYELLIRQDGSEASLRRSASTNPFRLTFYFPRVGTQAVMISETRGRTSSGLALLNWLKVKNQHEAVGWDRNGDRTEEPWVRWSADPMFDERRIDSIIRDGSDHSITLKRHKIDAADNRHTDGGLKMTKQGIPIGRIEDLRNTLRKWWDERALVDKVKKSSTAAHDLGVLVAPTEVLDKLSFDDGEITFDENGKTQTIDPNTIERLFVYPVGESRPSLEELREAARTRLQPLLRPLSLEIDLT